MFKSIYVYSRNTSYAIEIPPLERFLEHQHVGRVLSILVYEHGSEISILVGHGSPYLSTSMENDLSCPSVFFLIEKIDPSESIFLTRSFL
jgi:hypothetical protein